MVAGICAFTEKGKALAQKIKSSACEYLWIQKSDEEDLNLWVKTCFEKRLPLIFISAAGIAVRSVAPYIKDKIFDSSVIVIDENAKFVIPILSGHLGHGNEIAEFLAEKTGAECVITTATDVNQKTAADVFADKTGLYILNREEIKSVNSKILKGEKIKILVEKECFFWLKKFLSNYENLLNHKTLKHMGEDFIFYFEDENCFKQNSETEENLNSLKSNSSSEEKSLLNHQFEKYGIKTVTSENSETSEYQIRISSDKNLNFKFNNCLYLIPKNLYLGIGCKKGKSFEEIRQFVFKILKENFNLDSEEKIISKVCCVSSIDLKNEEEGLLNFAQYIKAEFKTFSAEELNCCTGNFSQSEFVEKVTGVSNVCERAAVLASNNGNLVLNKICENGITLAVGEEK